MPWLRASYAALGLNTTNTTNSSTTSQKIYLSFSHREEPAFLVTALGLFNDTSPNGGNINDTLPTDRVNYDRAWKTSEILPFLGHVGLERLECAVSDSATNGTSGTNGTETFIRVLVNSAPHPLPACSGNSTGPGGSCSADAFQQFMDARIQTYGDFDKECALNSTEEAGITFFGNVTLTNSTN